MLISRYLRRKFEYAAYFYMSAWEHDPSMRIENGTVIRDDNPHEELMIDTFQALQNTLDAVPADLMESIDVLRPQIGRDRYKQIVDDCIEGVGRYNVRSNAKFLPKNATEFVETVKIALVSDGQQEPRPARM